MAGETDFAAQVRWECLEYVNGDGLDLGCGDARPHDWFVGIDVKAGTTGRGPNLIMDARKLSTIASESQNYVFSSYLLNELVEQGNDLTAVLTEWWRLIKPMGYLFLFLPVTEKCAPKMVIDAMAALRPWQLCEAKTGAGGTQFIQCYRKADLPTVLDKAPLPDKVCAVVKLGAHGDALWSSSVFPHLKEQGYYTVLYTQDTGEEVLRHDPHIDKLIKFESRVPMGQLGELFQWIEQRYKHSRLLVEVVEGTLLPAPAKIQYHFPIPIREKLMNFNYLEFHHLQARVPYEPRQKFYPSEEEKVWANSLRMGMHTPRLVILVPNGSSVTKMWPHAAEFTRELLRMREDVTVIALGDDRGMKWEEFAQEPRFINAGLKWNVRQAMTMCQLSDLVIGQETGLLNCVAFEKEVAKIVLLSHSSHENLTRDWPNTASIGKPPPECGKTACHRLHYDWTFCHREEKTGAAKCQAAISVADVMDQVEQALPRALLRAVA
jgi:ADP-heptose:LPS heptosyltransferase